MTEEKVALAYRSNTVFDGVGEKLANKTVMTRTNLFIIVAANSVGNFY